jgi:hypothetical protein
MTCWMQVTWDWVRHVGVKIRSKFDLGTVGRLVSSLWSMFVVGWCIALKLVERGNDIARHGYIDTASLVVLLYGEAAVDFTLPPVHGNFVQVLKGFDEMASVLFANIFYMKVIGHDAEGEALVLCVSIAWGLPSCLVTITIINKCKNRKYMTERTK